MSTVLMNLPGPDTGAKAEAVKYAASDPRMATMLRLAEEHGWPQEYSDDLYSWDRNKLAEFPGCDVLWILRDCGTHIIILDRSAEHARAENQIATPIIEYWSGEHFLNHFGRAERIPRIYYVFSDGSAVETNTAEAKQVVNEFYPLNGSGDIGLANRVSA